MRDERRWRAIVDRDEQADDQFVYAVTTTGVYCRPSCGSRRPRRAHVRFFETSEGAERAGFRPCRRCRPGDADNRLERVKQVCAHIRAHADQPLTLSALASRVGLSPFHFQRAFKRAMGISPRQYADAVRLDAFKARLREGMPVTGALYDAGYGSSSRVYERVPTEFGMTPTTYRSRGASIRIVYTIASSPLGRVLVAATQRGVCAVKLGDSNAQLVADLRGEFSAAAIEPDNKRLKPWVTAVLAYLRGSQPHLDLPLDVRATAFQRRVWQALRAIPPGATRTYAEVARAIGQPRAVRAVARACATNPVALVVPCHRVVPKHGGAGGYRWGRARKARLLRQEKAVAAAGSADSRDSGFGVGDSMRPPRCRNSGSPPFLGDPRNGLNPRNALPHKQLLAFTGEPERSLRGRAGYG